MKDVVQVFEPEPVGNSLSWFARNVRRTSDTRNALNALKNRLSMGGLERVDTQELRRVLGRYGIRSRDSQNQVFQQCYRDAIASIALKYGLSDERARGILQPLGQVLGLEAAAIESNYRQVSHEIYRAAVVDAFGDKNLSDDEKVRLESLGSSLGLPRNDQVAIIQAEASLLISALGNELLADRRYSPEDEERIRSLVASLGAVLHSDQATEEQLKRFRLLWEIENGKLPELQVPITLQRGEICHFMCTCSWREMRTRTVRVDYAGVTASVKVMKGVRLRYGSIVPRRVTEAGLVEIASGRLYVTNKRALLDGYETNKVITWRSVFGIEAFADAIKLEKSAGKNPYLFVSDDSAELLGVIIAAALCNAK